MLSNIPTEILLHILSNLKAVRHPDIAFHDKSFAEESIKNSSTLAKLCLTCRSIRNVVQPVLYQSYYKPRILPAHVACKSTSLNHRLRLFLRTLVERPDLARDVRTMTIEGWETRAYCSSRPETECPGEELSQVLQAAAIRIDLGTYQDKWIEDLRRGTEDADMALLLLLAPIAGLRSARSSSHI